MSLLGVRGLESIRLRHLEFGESQRSLFGAVANWRTRGWEWVLYPRSRVDVVLGRYEAVNCVPVGAA